MKHGKHREYLQEIAEESGIVPHELIDEPELDMRLHNILEAFFLLAPDRPIGFGGVGAIPTASILALAPITGEDPMDFLTLCRAMDSAYMEHANQAKPKK